MRVPYRSVAGSRIEPSALTASHAARVVQRRRLPRRGRPPRATTRSALAMVIADPPSASRRGAPQTIRPTRGAHRECPRAGASDSSRDIAEEDDERSRASRRATPSGLVRRATLRPTCQRPLLPRMRGGRSASRTARSQRPRDRCARSASCPRACSGLMYAAVPSTMPTRVIAGDVMVGD